MKRRIVLGIAVVTAAVALASLAQANDCFNSSRSGQGSASAGANSRAWATVSVVDFAHSPGFPPGVDPDCFVTQWLAGGGPSSFTVHVQGASGGGGVIGGNSANPNLADGRGIDHIEDAYGALFGAALGACAL
ncbi:MAG TPA: hypothetical protein VJS92_10815 [Candidatus Polarisedimenticolaceae bacterium]|nr:hypothetical protein [Candidatus Polarisedimenticolaceae bacterium]